MCIVMHNCVLKSFQAQPAWIQPSETYQHSKQLERDFINVAGKKRINQIMKQCSATWTRNGLLGVLLVTRHFDRAQADSRVTISAHFRLIPPRSRVAIAA